MSEEKTNDDSLIEEQRENLEKVVGEEDKGKEGKKPEQLKEQVSELEGEEHKRRIKELSEIESRVDGKINQLREIVDENKREGRGVFSPPRRTVAN